MEEEDRDGFREVNERFHELWLRISFGPEGLKLLEWMTEDLVQSAAALQDISSAAFHHWPSITYGVWALIKFDWAVALALHFPPRNEAAFLTPFLIKIINVVYLVHRTNELGYNVVLERKIKSEKGFNS
ncbi:hypothetical protein QQP08_011945 [Theobroma cacao]|nr:hypothetical protein QQP08_011945 [Theobroma cacao]